EPGEERQAVGVSLEHESGGWKKRDGASSGPSPIPFKPTAAGGRGRIGRNALLRKHSVKPSAPHVHQVRPNSLILSGLSQTLRKSQPLRSSPVHLLPPRVLDRA